MFFVASFGALFGRPLFGRDGPTQSVPIESRELVYRLSPFDKISLSVYGEPDLSTVQLISDNGMVFVPLVGPLKLGGLTVSEASRLVEHTFVDQEFLRQPVVTISIEAFSPKIVTVLGEVERPGNVEIPPGRNGLPIQTVIAEAGGFTGTAKSTDVNITRASSTQAERSNEVVNVDKMLNSRKGREEEDYMVHPDDVVFVPRRVF